MQEGLIERTLKDISTSRPPRLIRDYSGVRLIERRYEARLIQEDLAALVGVSNQTVGFLGTSQEMLNTHPGSYIARNAA